MAGQGSVDRVLTVVVVVALLVRHAPGESLRARAEWLGRRALEAAGLTRIAGKGGVAAYLDALSWIAWILALRGGRSHTTRGAMWKG